MPGKYLWLLDPGHGGVIFGDYLTPGKRSPKLTDGRQLFEGEFNRAIVARLQQMCASEGLNCFDLVATHHDVPLRMRTDLANSIYRQKMMGEERTLCIYLSIHANAFGSEFNNARGWEVFTSPGETKSDLVATEFSKAMKKAFPDARFREDYSDKDPDKEENFYVLRKTAMPAILTENFFMTNREEVEILFSEEGRDKIAQAHFEAMQAVEAMNLIN